MQQELANGTSARTRGARGSAARELRLARRWGSCGTQAPRSQSGFLGGGRTRDRVARRMRGMLRGWRTAQRCRRRSKRSVCSGHSHHAPLYRVRRWTWRLSTPRGRCVPKYCTVGGQGEYPTMGPSRPDIRSRSASQSVSYFTSPPSTRSRGPLKSQLSQVRFTWRFTFTFICYLGATQCQRNLCMPVGSPRTGCLVRRRIHAHTVEHAPWHAPATGPGPATPHAREDATHVGV